MCGQEGLLETAKIRDYPAGSTILEQGKLAHCVYLMIEGEARAGLVSPGGQEVWIGDFRPGDFFGEEAALRSAGCGVQITAATAVRLAEIRPEIFTEIIGGSEAPQSRLAGQLSRRLAATTQRMIELHTMSVQERVCAELLRRARLRRPESAELIIRPAPVLSEIARNVFSTRETVSRVVNELIRSEVLKREPGAMVILAPEDLADHA